MLFKCIKIIKEYGFLWCIYKIIYVLKIKFLNINENSWKLFEKKEKIFRIDIFSIDVKHLERFYEESYTKLEKKEILIRADEAIKGELYAFSKVKLDYGRPIRWNYNPITKKNVDKNKMWFKIKDFNNEIGDIKIIWEPSRFCHFYLFSKAYIITKDIKYYNAFISQVKKWNSENIYPYGPNYKCGQESAIRMINLLMNYSVFKEYNLIDEDDCREIMLIVKNSYKKLLSNFFYAEKCVRNNHTISELMGLIIGAWCEKNEKRKNKYYKKIIKQLKKQIMTYGGYIQYSFNYHRLVLQMVEVLLKINDKLEINLDNKVKKIINKSIFMLYQLQAQNGKMPNYGSNDGALIIPVSNTEYNDFSSIINSLSILLNKSIIYEEPIYREEAIWFSNENFYELKKVKLEKKSNQFNETGLYSLRDNNKYMMIICNKLKKNRPSQMDQLHIDLWYKGENILCDSGTYSYANKNDDEYIFTSNHNTIKIDNIEQMEKTGHFLCYNWPISKLIFFSKEEFIGQMYSKNGKYKHIRDIKINKNGFEIKDKVKVNRNKKKCYLNFHTVYNTYILENDIIIENEIFYCSIEFKEKLNIRVEEDKMSFFYFDNTKGYKIIVEKEITENQCEFDYIINIKEKKEKVI